MLLAWFVPFVFFACYSWVCIVHCVSIVVLIIGRFAHRYSNCESHWVVNSYEKFQLTFSNKLLDRDVTSSAPPFVNIIYSVLYIFIDIFINAQSCVHWLRYLVVKRKTRDPNVAVAEKTFGCVYKREILCALFCLYIWQDNNRCLLILLEWLNGLRFALFN